MYDLRTIRILNEKWEQKEKNKNEYDKVLEEVVKERDGALARLKFLRDFIKGTNGL